MAAGQNVKPNRGNTEMTASVNSDTTETLASGKLRWEPMKLVPVGTVAALLEAVTGSKGDGGGGGMMMVGL
jgi:hypothetical protein